MNSLYHNYLETSMKRICIVMALCMLGGCASNVPKSSSLKICFFPMDLATFGAITKLTIEKEKCSTFRDDDPTIATVLGELAQSNNPPVSSQDLEFDENRVRLEIQYRDSSQVVFGDAAGVIESGTTAYKLSDRNKDAVNKAFIKIFHDEKYYDETP